MTQIPVYINVRDYGSPAMLMVAFLRRIPRARPILVDNASTWPPLVDWLGRAPCEVIRLPENRGPRAALTILEATLGPATRFVLTDGDLDLCGVPLDVLDVLADGLAEFPDVAKIGLSLEIDDLPAGYPFRDRVRALEGRYWRTARFAGGRRWWESDIETTFAMHRVGDPYAQYGPALRADRPYTARHVPWHFTSDTLTPEYLHYVQRSEFNSGIYWTTLAKDHPEQFERQEPAA